MTKQASNTSPFAGPVAFRRFPSAASPNSPGAYPNDGAPYGRERPFAPPLNAKVCYFDFVMVATPRGVEGRRPPRPYDDSPPLFVRLSSEKQTRAPPLDQRSEAA